MDNRRILFCVVISAATLTTAMAVAADRPVYKAPVAPIAAGPNWTGPYGGVHLGYGSTRDSATYVSETAPAGGFVFPLGTVVESDNDGVIGGLQLGYNYQVNRLVFGAEGDISWTNARVSKTVIGTLNVPSSAILSADNHWFATLAARAGVTEGAWLFYGKAGAAWTNVTYGGSATVGAVTNPRSDLTPTRSGWMLGVGAEWQFQRNWSAKIEYNYLDFGTLRITPNSALGFLSTFDIDSHAHLVKVGVNWRPGMP